MTLFPERATSQETLFSRPIDQSSVISRSLTLSCLQALLKTAASRIIVALLGQLKAAVMVRGTALLGLCLSSRGCFDEGRNPAALIRGKANKLYTYANPFAAEAHARSQR